MALNATQANVRSNESKPALTPQYGNAAGYVRPSLVVLGNLEVVQAGNGFYYDGTGTRWLRFNR
jgi:hypothetical protein